MKTGELVVFETEEYSDFSIAGIFVALRDFSLDEQLEKFMAEHPIEGKGPSQLEKFDHVKFMNYLVDFCFLREQDAIYAHLGSYGEKPDRGPLEKESK